MAIDLTSLGVGAFCELQGIDGHSKFAVVKLYPNITKSYEEWFEFLKNDIVLGDQKEFNKKEEETTE